MMRATIGLLLLSLAACSGESGPAECVAAGGQCVVGGTQCANPGTADCNPDRNPGGFFCCLPCPKGTNPNDAGTACE
jgi:hypothetical protein